MDLIVCFEVVALLDTGGEEVSGAEGAVEIGGGEITRRYGQWERR